MSITAAQVKELRERTGAGMMECKKALLEVNGDIDAAIELMRKSGQAKAAKKAGRIAAEGIIAVSIASDNKSAFMVEVNSETDFVARDENFKSFVAKVAACGLANNAETLEQLLAAPLGADSANNVAVECEGLIGKIGENVQIRRVAFVRSEGVVAAYCHGARIGVLVNMPQGTQELGKDVAMHIAACKPEVVNPEDLPAELLAKEKEIYIAQAEQSGKPREIAEKMVVGKIKKFMGEVSLVGQLFVKDPTITVGELLQKTTAKVAAFVRFEVGEGIEKEETDFAAEVKAQVEGKA